MQRIEPEMRGVGGVVDNLVATQLWGQWIEHQSGPHVEKLVAANG